MCSVRIFKASMPFGLVSHVHFLSSMRYHRLYQVSLVLDCPVAPAQGLDCRTPIAPIRSPIRSRSTSQNFSAERGRPVRRFNLGSFFVITGLALPWSRTSVRFSQSPCGFCESLLCHTVRITMFIVCIICAFYTLIWAHCLLRNWRFQVPKNLEMTFPNAARPLSFADGPGICKFDLCELVADWC